MNQLLKSISVFSIGVLIYTLLGSSCLPKFPFSANGSILGTPVRTTVDSELAKQIMEDPYAKEVTNFFKKHEDKALNTGTLSEISKEYSVDGSLVITPTKAERVQKDRVIGSD